MPALAEEYVSGLAEKVEGPSCTCAKVGVSLGGTVERVFTPGAPKSTVLAPKLEKLARLSFMSVAATTSILASR